jgi:glucose-6-phosphate isomerase
MPPAYYQYIENCLAETIGGTGLDTAAFETLLTETRAALTEISGGGNPEIDALTSLVASGPDLSAAEDIAEHYTDSFDDVVVLGTGGSSLGGATLAAVVPPPAGNPPNRPRLHFMDNIDPVSFDALFSAITPERTGFLVISKSGGTAETMAQFLYSLDVFRQTLKDKAPAHFSLITEPGDRPLRAIGEDQGMAILDHDPHVGGRFSALSLVGLLPAMIAGVDIDAVRDGAAEVLATCAGAPEDCPPAVGAAVNVGLQQQKDCRAAILMPYSDRLAPFGKWFRQLWAESLGKSGQGTLPVDALGAVDQHSQLQLYLDGPRDKLFTLILPDVAGQGGLVPADLAGDPALDYLSGRRMGDLMAAEQSATRSTLAAHGCPVRTFDIAGADEKATGALLMHFILETIIAARLMGVNPFGQPAVEEGKELARKLMRELPRP